MISVALIDDNRIVREGLASVLNGTSGLRVVAAARGGDAAALRQAKPLVVLLCVDLGDRESLRVAETVKREVPDARLIITDLLPARDDLLEFVNAGVAGFVLKDATVAELVITIRSVAGGAHVLPPTMTSSFFSQIARGMATRGRMGATDAARMTVRERETVELIGEGLSNKEISARLNIATHTVKSHVRNVMEKLDLHTRLQIAAFAHRSPAA